MNTITKWLTQERDRPRVIRAKLLFQAINLIFGSMAIVFVFMSLWLFMWMFLGLLLLNALLGELKIRSICNQEIP